MPARAQQGGLPVVTESAMFIRRLALVFSIVFCASLALAAAAVAAGGMGPGKYTFNSSSANAFFGMGKKGGPPVASWQVSVNQGLNSFKPTHPNGLRIVTNSTMVFVSEFDALGNGGVGGFFFAGGSFTGRPPPSFAGLRTHPPPPKWRPPLLAPPGG